VLAAAALIASACQAPWGEDQRLNNPTRILGQRATVIVTTDGGRELLVKRAIPLEGATTALEALQAVADVRMQNDVVYQVNGYGPGRLTALGPEQSAWFFRVNGIESTADPARFKVRRGSSIWWDLRRYDIYRRLPVAAGIFPDPLILGYRDSARPVRIAYGSGFREDAEFFEQSLLRAVSPEVRSIKGDDGLIGAGRDSPRPAVAVRKRRANLVIGRWEELVLDPYISEIGLQPREFGLTVWIEGTRIRRQDPDEEFSRELEDAEGVVWASTVDAEPDSALVYVITGITERGVRAAARAVRRGDVQYRLAAAVTRDGTVIP